MAKPRPQKKREPAASAERRVLPMELRVGDRPRQRDRRVGSDRATVHNRRRKDRSRAGPENRRACQLGNTRLGRCQADQREAQGGGSAMTRHVRRASLFATFSLLALAWGLVGCQPGFHIFPLPTMVKEGMTTQSFAQDKLECHTYRFLGVD